MNSIWKVGAAAVTVAMLGGFYLGRVASDTGPLPAVGQPVTVGATAEPTPSAAQTPTLRPRPDRTTPERPTGTRSPEDRFDDHGGNRADDDDDDDFDDNSGPGGGGDDDFETIEPPATVMTFDDDGGDDNSGPGGGGDDSGGDDH